MFLSFRFVLSLLVAGVVLAGAPTQAQAADGCKVLLCLAGNWKNISPCIPDVREALRDSARGRPWPRCEMANGGGGAGNTRTRMDMRPASAPNECPVQYTQTVVLESTTEYYCTYSGYVDVVVDGQPWSRVWWTLDEQTSTEYFPAARAQMPADQLDPKFDTDLAAYNEAQRLAAEAAAAAAAAAGWGGS